MSWRAMQRNQKNRAGGLTGRDRGWLPGTSQSNTIGIPSHLVNKVRDKTNTLVTKENAQNIAGGTLTKPIDYPNCKLNQTMLIDTRCLVVEQNQLSGVGRFRSQFNVDADGITQARYYLSITPNEFQSNSCNNCKKQNPGCSICINTSSLQSLNNQKIDNLTAEEINRMFLFFTNDNSTSTDVDSKAVLDVNQFKSDIAFVVNNQPIDSYLTSYLNKHGKEMTQFQFTNFINSLAASDQQNLYKLVPDNLK